jgi:hypothetical protein
MIRDAFTREPDDTYATEIVVGTDWEQIDGQAFAVDLTTGQLQNYARGSATYSCAAEPCPDAVLDFAMPATPPAMTHRTVTLAYPTGFDAFPSTPVIPTGDNYVLLFELLGFTDTDGARVGTVESVEASASPVGLTTRIGWVADLAGFPETDAIATFQVPGNDAFTVLCEMRHYGLPADGATIEVLEPPVFTTPPDVATPFPVSSATAAWTLPDWASYAVLWLYSSDLRTLNWLVILPRNVTTFRFPPLPASFTAMSFPQRLGIYAQGFEGAPASVWELFNLGESFTGRYIGNLYDVRYRAVR